MSAEIDKERYKKLEGVDNSVEAMQDRLIKLQPSLSLLMNDALKLFDNVYPQAPHPAHATDPPIAYATASVNLCPIEGVPMARELTIVLGTGRWLRIFRNSEGSPNEYPRERLWFWRPEGDVDQQINVMKTHNPNRNEYPYDIETADYKSGTCRGFVGGAPYYGQEPFIAEASSALDDAHQIATDSGFFVEVS